MKKVIFTALVAVVAIGGALATDANVKRAPIPGSFFNTKALCDQFDFCDSEGTYDCITSLGQQLYGEDLNGKCTIPLKRLD